MASGARLSFLYCFILLIVYIIFWDMWLQLLFACINFLIKLRCEFIILYSFIYYSNDSRSHIKYLDHLIRL